MARPAIPADQRKKPRAVSLTDEQNAKLQALGGSPWLQSVLNASLSPEDLALARSMTGLRAHKTRSTLK